MGKIRDILKNNRKIYSFVKVMKLFKNGVAWRCLSDYASNPRVITFTRYGDKNVYDKFYHITIGNSMTGMYSLVTWTLRKLEFAEFFNLTPYVTWSEDVTVADKNKKKNPFEIYFKQVSDISMDELLESANVAESREIDLVYEERLKSYNFSDDEIKRLAPVYRKYIRLQDDLEDKIKNDIQKLLGNSSGKILAVHVRGADWRNKNIDGHPIAMSEDYYIKLTEKFIDKYHYETVFLATDSDSTIELFKNYFGSKVRFYSDVNRTPKDSDALVIFDNARNPVSMGNEIIRDVYTMAYCDSIIAGLSYVSYVARILKKSRNEQFEYEKIVDKGIASNIHSLKRAESKQRNSTRK